MKFYQVVVSKGCDEFVEYSGVDIECAKAAQSNALADYDRLTRFDKERTSVECRAYDIDDTVNVNDSDELVNALCDCIGYDPLNAETDIYKEASCDLYGYCNGGNCRYFGECLRDCLC